MALRVNLDHVATSATSVTEHGENVAAAHQQSDGRIVSAHAGWQGSSAQALAGKVDAWAQTSATLLSRMSDHAQGLHNTVQGISTFEDERVQVMDDVAASGDAVSPKSL